MENVKIGPGGRLAERFEEILKRKKRRTEIAVDFTAQDISVAHNVAESQSRRVLRKVRRIVKLSRNLVSDAVLSSYSDIEWLPADFPSEALSRDSLGMMKRRRSSWPTSHSYITFSSSRRFLSNFYRIRHHHDTNVSAHWVIDLMNDARERQAKKQEKRSLKCDDDHSN